MILRMHSFALTLPALSILAMFSSSGCDQSPEALTDAPPVESTFRLRDAGPGLESAASADGRPASAEDEEDEVEYLAPGMGQGDAPEGRGGDGEPAGEGDDERPDGEGRYVGHGGTGGEDGDGEDEVCSTISARANASLRPVDIVWVIDSSPSMDDEIAIIQANLNDFTARIGASGLDYRVVMIAAEEFTPTDGRDYFGVCIPPPLSGAPGCPDTDSDRYFHVREGVHSRDALSKLLATRPQYAHFLRPDAALHIVVVTDDEQGHGARADDFFASGFGESVFFHSIVDEVGRPPGCGPFGDPCSCGEARGQTYIDLSERTGGVVVSVCSQDWGPIFTSLEERVRTGNEIPCSFEIPTPVGAVIDFERVNVDFVNGAGDRMPLLYSNDCAAHPNSWFYDNELRPTRIELCPGACGAIEGDVEVEFGCDMRKE